MRSPRQSFIRKLGLAALAVKSSMRISFGSEADCRCRPRRLQAPRQGAEAPCRPGLWKERPVAAKIASCPPPRRHLPRSRATSSTASPWRPSSPPSVAHYGWPRLGERIPVRCFQTNPSIKSSLTFLRRTPWAREKVEGLYLFMLRDQRRSSRRPDGTGED